jgi:TPP-dependent indolepyruvate ferredoxin oxidoreductase alpha subunit
MSHVADRPFDTVVIDHGCTACGACLITCPTRSLVARPRRPFVIDDRCISCGECIEICPRGAISDAVSLSSMAGGRA